MSPLLEQVLADIDRLDPQERLQIVAHLVPGWRQQPDLLAKPKISRKDLFGCLRGQIEISDDFNEPLSDFAEYMY
ncbi:MAG: DUF2281 domain-containing protein [Chamaesiphon sp.]|nr:DUF2281 domain-containing protein [Chamaesiphon sp.]